jgi:O-antigen/teichoic acid export membrane protein
VNEELTTSSVEVLPEAAPAAPSALRQQVVSGIGWKIVTQVVLQATRILVAIILARLLVPRDFGLASMALLFVGVASVFIDLSLGPALIARRTITEADRSTAFWTTLAAGTSCAIAGVALSPLVADFFSTPEVGPLFAVTSILFLITSFSSTQTALLTRELQFRSLQLRQIAGAVIAGAVGVSLAFAGFGAWAIVIQALTAEAVSLVLVWRFSSWRPHFTYSVVSLRKLGPFAVKASGARILGYVNLNADNFLIARFLGATPLGIYSVAYNVMFAPFARLAQPIQEVLFPAFARLAADPPRTGAAWLRGTRIVAAITVPVFVGLAIVAPDFVPVVLGERWVKAVPVLEFLCIAGLAQSLVSLNHSLLQALDRAGTLLAFMIFSATITVASFVVGLHWGVVGVAAGFAFARTLALPVFTAICCRVAQVRMRAVARNLRPLLEVAAAMGILAYGARLGLENAGVPAGYRLVAVVAIGAASYIGLLVWRQPALVKEIVGLARRRP